MKKIILLVLAFMVTAILAADEKKTDPCNAVNETAIRMHLPLQSFSIESKKSHAGLCEVIIRVKSRLIPLYAGDNYIIAGDLYSFRKKVTTESVAAVKKRIFMEHVSRLDEAAAMTYVPKKKKGGVIYVFIDPLCPYCHDAGKGIIKLSEKYGVTLKVLLYSVHGEKGTMKSVEAVCRKFNFSEYNNLKWKTAAPLKKYQCERGSKLVKTAEGLSDSLGVDGVPAFYFDNGTFVSGAEMDAIEAELKKIHK